MAATPTPNPPLPTNHSNGPAAPSASAKPGLLDGITQWYFYSFLTHFLAFMPLSLTILLCASMLTNAVGESYGVDKLVWHDDWLKQFFVGASITLLCAQVFFVGYLLWLRDRREGYLKASFSEVGFGRYSWQMLGCFLATGAAIWVAAWLLGRLGAHLRPGQPVPTPHEAQSLPYRIPWLLLAGALLAGCGLWLSLSRLGQGSAPRLRRIFCVGLFALGVAVVTTALISTALRDDERDLPHDPPSSWSLVLGGFLGGVGVWLLTRISDWIGLGKGRLGQRLWQGIMDRLADLRSPTSSTYGRWQRLPWICAVLVWAVWALLTWEAYHDNPHELGLGLGLVLIGFLVTVLAFLRHSKGWFFACLVANIMAAAALLTYVPSNLPVTSGLLLLYPLAPVALVLTLAVLIGYAPRAAAEFFAESADPTKSKVVEPGSAEDVGRERATWAVLGGWFFFAILAGSPWASPIPMVCALLFVCVGVYGLATYLFRGAGVPLLAALVVLAILSGVNRYKFRFAEPLDQYEAGLEYVKSRSPLPVHQLLQDDQERIEKAVPHIYPYLSAKEKLERMDANVNAIKGAIKEATQENIARLKKQLAEYEKEQESAETVAANLISKAQEVFQELRRTNKILEPANSFAPYSPAAVIDLLGDKKRDDGLLEVENVGWEKFGALGGGHPLDRDKKLDRDTKRPLLLLTVSGGGLRSAVWTLLILHQLERAFADPKKLPSHVRKKLDFPAHARMITGASGGMLGAAYYVGTLKEPHKRLSGADRDEELQDQVERLRQDAIAPLMRQLIFGDVPNFFSPWPARYDRGQALEAAWKKHLGEACGEALNAKFGQLRPYEKAGWCPSLVFTPMMIEDGRRLIISNLNMFAPISNDGNILHLKKNSAGHYSDLIRRGVPRPTAEKLVMDRPLHWIGYQIKTFDKLKARGDERLREEPAKFLEQAVLNNVCHLPPMDEDVLAYFDNYSIEALELFRLLPDARDVTLGTAVRMSASFPFFSPAVSLPTWPRRRVVDAGYYDNYGVGFSAAWLFSRRHKEWLRENVSRVCIVQIRDGVSDAFRKLEKVRPDGSTELSRALEEVFSPLQGMENARVSSSSFRNDGQLELLSHYMFETMNMPFAVVNFENPVQAALNWRLSEREFRALSKEADAEEVGSRIVYLLDFLYGPLAEYGPRVPASPKD